MEKYFQTTNYFSSDNKFHCYISRTVPAGCEVSFFSIPLSVLRGTRGERPTDNVKQKTLTDR